MSDRFSHAIASTRWRRACAWFAFSVNCHVMANPAEGTTGPSWLHIELSPHVALERSTVSLADVATLSSPDLVLLRRAMGLNLGGVSNLRDGRRLDRDLIAASLSRHRITAGEHIRWSGATSAQVFLRTQRLLGVEIAAVAKRALQAHLLDGLARSGVNDAGPELNLVIEPADLLQLGEGNTLRARPLTGVVPSKRMLVWVEVVGARGPVRTIPVRFDVIMPATRRNQADVDETADLGRPSPQKAMRTQPESAMKLPRVSVDPQAPGPSTVAAADVPHRPLADRPGVSRRPGDETAYAVRRGEWAKLQSQRGSLNIEVSAQVLQDAQVGQQIRVKPRHAFTSVAARVLGPGQLEALP